MSRIPVEVTVFEWQRLRSSEIGRRPQGRAVPSVALLLVGTLSELRLEGEIDVNRVGASLGLQGIGLFGIIFL